jgi:hypothetical protein
MATERINDSRAFRDFLDAKLEGGDATLPLDEALFEWEMENQTDEEQEETIRAIQRGFDDIDAGRVKPAGEALRQICQKLGLPDPTR